MNLYYSLDFLKF